MHGTQHALTAALVGILVVGTLVPVTAIASADSDDSLAEIEVDVDDIDAWLAAAAGAWERAQIAFARDTPAVLGGSEPGVEEQADRLDTFVDDHNGSLVEHTNEVLAEYNATVRNDTYVLLVEIADDVEDPSTTETVYIVATADGTNLTDLRATRTTDRTVDRSTTLGVHKATALNDDLRDYREEYVEPGTVPEQTYYIQKGATYGDIQEFQQQ